MESTLSVLRGSERRGEKNGNFMRSETPEPGEHWYCKSGGDRTGAISAYGVRPRSFWSYLHAPVVLAVAFFDSASLLVLQCFGSKGSNAVPQNVRGRIRKLEKKKEKIKEVVHYYLHYTRCITLSCKRLFTTKYSSVVSSN